MISGKIILASELLLVNAEDIHLSNPRYNEDFGNPIRGTQSLRGTIWDSPIGEIRCGFDKRNPENSVIYIRHNDIAPHVHGLAIHHWGFLGILEIPSSIIELPWKNRVFDRKTKFNDVEVLACIKSVFEEWKRAAKTTAPIRNIPNRIDGKNIDYETVRPNPSIRLGRLPLEHHKDAGVQTFNARPEEIFIHWVEPSRGNRKMTYLRFEFNTYGWRINPETNGWSCTKCSLNQYASLEFVQQMVDNYKLMPKAPVIEDPLCDGLGRTFI